MFLNVYVTGVGPVPQQPPEGYVVQRTQATFQWDMGNRDKPISLEVSMDDPDFTAPLLDRKVTGTTHTMTKLQPGHRYYWRLRQGDKISPVASFETSENAVNF